MDGVLKYQIPDQEPSKEKEDTDNLNDINSKFVLADGIGPSSWGSASAMSCFKRFRLHLDISK